MKACLHPRSLSRLHPAHRFAASPLCSHERHHARPPLLTLEFPDLLTQVAAMLEKQERAENGDIDEEEETSAPAAAAAAADGGGKSEVCKVLWLPRLPLRATTMCNSSVFFFSRFAQSMLPQQYCILVGVIFMREVASGGVYNTIVVNTRRRTCSE